MMYPTIDIFFTALQSGQLKQNEVDVYFDGMTFYAMDKAQETEYISGEWEEVYAFFKARLQSIGLHIIEENL